MKKTFVSLLFLTLFTVCHSAVITVNNNPTGPGQYSDLQQALDAASPGDTIHIHGSATSYGNVNFNKPLTIMGPGRNPQKDVPMRADVYRMTLNAGADGSRIYGITGIGVNSYINCAEQVNDLVIRGCEYDYLIIRGNNVAVEDNWFWGEISLDNFLPNAGNIIIGNNIFGGMLRYFDNSGVTITNNLFYSNSSGTAFGLIDQGGQEVIVENNIFYGATPNDCSGCVFNNNITYATSQDMLPYGSNTGNNNLIWNTPGFADAALPGQISTTELYAYNWQLTAGSPGENAGTDGTDIGLFGGISPFTLSGNAPIPQIRSFNISNATVPVGGQLQINVVATPPE